ncbi:unnamed protein product [Absidia cylindrospora]
MATRNKILVTGSPGIGTLDVVEGVFTSSNQTIPAGLKPTTTDDQQPQQQLNINGLIIPWTIDNKYYTASVDFWLDEPKTNSLKETISAYSETDNGVGQVVDAFIYVFKQHDDFEWIKQWLHFLENCEPAIRLCIKLPATSATVVSKSQSVTHEEPSTSDDTYFEDWCLENQFGYIDISQPPSDIPMDKSGYDLVVDELHTNMWDGLSRKDGKKTQTRLPDVFDASFDGSDDVDDADDQLVADDLSNDMNDDEWIKEIEKLKLEHDKSIGTEKKDVDMGFDDDFELPTKEDIGKMHDQLFGDIDQDDGLDRALQSLQAMREKGKDLPDEERRKMAAQVALSFAAQLGL